MNQLIGFLLHPHFLKLAKKNRKNVEIHPHFQSAFGTAVFHGSIVCTSEQKQLQRK